MKKLRYNRMRKRTRSQKCANFMAANKQNQSVRFDETTRAELVEVAALAGLTPADLVRICVREALPLVRTSFEEMRSRFADLKASTPPKGGHSDSKIQTVAPGNVPIRARKTEPTPYPPSPKHSTSLNDRNK